MIDEADPRLPNTSTPWQLWYSDLFDQDLPASVQARGTNVILGLRELWHYTLSEGIQDDGHASFSRFHLTWGETGAARADISVHPFSNPSLLKLRQWAGLMSQSGEVEAKDRDALLSRLAQAHYDLLRQSKRWQAAAIDWSAESGELLARVEVLADPREL